MMQLHDHPGLELKAQGRKENINFLQMRAQQANKFKQLSKIDRQRANAGSYLRKGSGNKTTKNKVESSVKRTPIRASKKTTML